MSVKWSNVAVLALVVAAFMVFAHAPDAIGMFLGSMRRAGPGHAPDDQFIGLLAFGLIALVITAVTKIVIEANRKE